MKGKKLAGEGIRYLIAGFISMAASWAAMWLADQVLFHGTVRPSPAQNAILGLANWTAGMLAAYVLNRKFVFRSSGPVLPELGKHTVSRLGTLALDQAVRQAAAAAGLTLYPATLAALCAVTIANYAVGKLLVFRNGPRI